MFRAKVNWIRKLSDKNKVANISIYLNDFYIGHVEILEKHIQDFLGLFECTNNTEKKDMLIGITDISKNQENKMSKIIDDNGHLTPEFAVEVKKILDVKLLNSFLLGLSIPDISIACMEIVGMINLSLCEAFLMKRFSGTFGKKQDE